MALAIEVRLETHCEPTAAASIAAPGLICHDQPVPRGYMEGPAAERRNAGSRSLERGVEEEVEERLAVFGSTADDPEKHFIGWRDDVDRTVLRLGQGLGPFGARRPAG